MTLRSYVWGMRLLGLASLVAFWSVLSYVDPEAWGISGQFLFYLTLLLFLYAFFTLILLFVRKITLGKEMASNTAGLSLRQGFLLALLAISLMILQSFQLLVWWDGLLVVAGIFLAELYFLSRN